MVQKQADSAPSPAKGIPAPEKIKRILVCQLRQIGDVLLATPALELLARHYPHAKIEVFTEKKCIPMLENNPHVHKIIPLDKKALASTRDQLAFYWRLGRDKYDLLVSFQHLPRCTWVALFSNIKTRLASGGAWYAKFLYTHTPRTLPGYAPARKASLLRALGISWNGELPRLYLTEAERAAGDKILREMGLAGKRFVSVDSTHFDPERLWPRPNYAALMDMLAEARPDLHFMLSYGPGEEWQVRELMALCRHQERLATFPRPLGLREVAACMERAVIHLGNCSAPRHMAVALGLPSFIPMGNTGEEWTCPTPEHRHIKARDLIKTDDATPPNDMRFHISALTPEMVLPAFLAHLDAFGKK